MTTDQENALYKPLSDLFLNQGFFVISGADKKDKGIIGTSEFGLKINESIQTADIVAAKWTASGELYSIGVEAKLQDSARSSAGAALYQATDYQLF